MEIKNIPHEVIETLAYIKDAGFEAYIVGGCVRDLLREKTPKDWDVATNAKPEEIQKIFSNSFYANDFGTVTVQTKTLAIEITTYRVESTYTNKRHPDVILHTNELKEDLARRDFTINAMALNIVIGKKYNLIRKSNKEIKEAELIDPFHGEIDLKNKTIRAVGDAKKRFEEDALRLMRGVRFSAQLSFTIEENTLNAIKDLSKNISFISQERIRDEWIKIIMSKKAHEGMELLRETGMLRVIHPEIMEGYGVAQNKHHIYTVYDHNIRALKYTAEQNYNMHVRMASLLHDVAKPRTKRGSGINATFYAHDIVGAKMTRQILNRLKFPKKDVERIALLVRYHLFYYNVGEVTPSSIRRLVKNVGLENMDDLINVRFADRIGSGVPKAEPYKLRHFRYLVETVSKDPISVKMLQINGENVIDILQINPGPKVGILLNALLSEVLDNPERNKKEYLEKRIKELDNFSISELSDMVKKSEDQISILEAKERKKYRV